MARRFDDEIHRSRALLGNPYAYLNGDGGYDTVPTGSPADRDQPESTYPLINADELLEGRSRGRSFSKQQLQDIARQLQRAMWQRREDLWPGRKDVDPLEILDPTIALRCIGFPVRVDESLGQFSGRGESFEVAGILDRPNSEVHVSRRFSPEIRNFTTAHELGHAILHKGSGLHRDRALDGSPGRRPRDQEEREADTFAAYFLLPEKQVRAVFERLFLTQHFSLNEETAFALTSESLTSLENKCRTLRDLTQMLAAVERYNGFSFPSIAKQFRVSTEAMAIRLEELGLVSA